MRLFSAVMVLVAAGNLLGEDQLSPDSRKNSWIADLLANHGQIQPYALRRDYPMQALSFQNICGWKHKDSATTTSLAGFENILRDHVFMTDRHHFENELTELDRILTLAKEQKPRALLTLFERTLFREQNRWLKELPPVAFVRRTRYGLRRTNATMFSQRTERGSAICIMEPGTGNVRAIFETVEGFIFDIKPSYDGRRLVMSYKPDNDSPFHIWEINIDGTGLRQITDGPYHDFNPVYYPDGRIIFSSSRVESFSLCQDFLACALYAVDPDGTNLRRIDFTSLCSNAPNVMRDGSIICTRWEYQDKNIFSWQKLYTIYPDGRQLKLYFGNTITVPNSLYGPQPIPDTDKVLITMAAHHHPPIGDIAILDRSKRLEDPQDLMQITHATSYKVAAGANWRDCNWAPGDGFFPGAYADPWPVNAAICLVSFGDNGLNRHGLYILGYNGILLPLYLHDTQSCFSAVTLNQRTKPATIAAQVPLESGTGTFFVQDIYQGLIQQGVKQGAVKALRLIRQIPKKWNTEGPRFHDHYPVAGYGSYYIKENLGTAPVDEDGTAYFIAPANCELYFIALDGHGKEVQRMGSVTQITTGERVSCIGCHEHRMKAPAVAPKAFRRLRKPPDDLTPPPSGAGPFDYVKQVQPVFDQYCVKCHSGRNPKARLDLTGDKTRFFNMSYDQLIQRGQVEFYYINAGPTGVFPALQTGSMASRLTKLIENNHGEVNLDDDGRRAVYAWIDSNVQYYGTWDMSRPHTTGGRDAWFEFTSAGNVPVLKPEKWMQTLAAAYNKNCLSCHGELYLPLGADMSTKNSWINLTHPEQSRLINAHLSSNSGGMGIVTERNSLKPPVFSNPDDPRYREMLMAIERGRDTLLAKPRLDMPGGHAVPQERNFGKVF